MTHPPSAPARPCSGKSPPVPRPCRRRLDGLHDALRAPFLIIGIALFFYSLLLYPQAASVPDGGNALVTTAFSLPFGGIGAFLVFGPLVEARTAHRDIRYALTTRAAYVIRQGRFPG